MKNSTLEDLLLEIIPINHKIVLNEFSIKLNNNFETLIFRNEPFGGIICTCNDGDYWLTDLEYYSLCSIDLIKYILTTTVIPNDTVLPLRFTSSKPYSFFSLNDNIEPLVDIKQIPELGTLINQHIMNDKSCFIDGEAETFAGFDIPIFIDGDMSQLNLPIEKQKIIMVLQDGNYLCECHTEGTIYYLRLREDQTPII